MDKTKFTPELISELKGFYVERVVDNMDTKDLVNYVMDDLDRYYEKMSDVDFLEDAYNYWEDSFDEVVEDIKEYTDCKFKKDRREEGKNVREQLLDEGFVPHDTDDTFIDINNTGGKY